MRKARDLEEEKEVVIGKGFIRFEWFEDGWDENEPKRLDLDVYLPQLERVGKQVLPTIISQQNPPVSCLINNPFILWVSDVAQSLSLPSALLWIQSCASFSSYYHYYHKLVSFPSQSHPHIHVQLPCMPLLNYDQVPSFLYPTTPYPFLRRAILGQFQNLHKSFCILMDTFFELECDNLQYMSSKTNCPIIKSVGPLFKSSRNNTVRGDLLKPDDDCIEWLNSKPTSSVVYIFLWQHCVLETRAN